MQEGTKQLVSIEWHPEDHYAIVCFQNKPVNSFTLEMMQAVIDAIDQIEKTKGMNAIVFTSAVPKIFSAGLDLKSMYNVPESQFEKFWSTLQRFFLKIYGCPLFTVALINGQCFAGGCLFSLCCDYRVMQNVFKIGLNEAQFGLVAPWWFIAAYENVIGKRQCEMHIQLGTLHTTEEALKIGLLDEVHQDLDAMSKSAILQVKKWNKAHQEAKKQSKVLMRKELYDKLANGVKEDIAFAWKWINSQQTQAALGVYLQSLQKKPQADRSSKL